MQNQIIHFNLPFPTMKGNESFTFLRSHSTKERPPDHSSEANFPPRLSAANAASLSLHDFQTRPSFSTADTLVDNTNIAYRCVSSVLKKDGQIMTIASANGLIYTGSQGSIIRVWKLPEVTEVGQLKSKASHVVALHVESDRVYAAYADCKIRIWRRVWEGVVKHVRVGTMPAAGSFVRSYISGRDRATRHFGPVSSLAVNTSEGLLYSASLDKTVKVWRISDSKCIETIQAHQEPINAIVVTEDGILYTASDDATVKVWQRNFCSKARPHSLTVTLPVKGSPVRTLSLTSEGGVLYGGCNDGYVHYWIKGWFSGQLQYGGALSGHTHAVLCLSSVADYVASGSADATSRVWVRDTGGAHTCVAVLQGHRGPIRCVAVFSGCVTDENDKEGCTVCTGSVDGVLKVWQVWSTTNKAKESSQSARDYFELS